MQKKIPKNVVYIKSLLWGYHTYVLILKNLGGSEKYIAPTPPTFSNTPVCTLTLVINGVT